MTVALYAACGDSGRAPSAMGSPSPDDAPIGDCQIEMAAPPDEGHAHVPVCTAVSYQSRPPSSGSHYASWPVFRIYDHPVPWGFLVHGLEHGAVVVAYNCPDGCATQIDQIKALYASLPPRESCSGPPVIVAPDPTLDVPFAASAWGVTLRAQCFDRDRFAAFIDSHRDHGREYFPGDCGAVDLEASGWCAQP